MKTILYFLFFLHPFISSISAQTFTEITEGGWGEGREFVRPCFADIDDDGLLDLIIGERTGTLEHLEQETPGSSTFLSLAKKFNNITVGSNSDAAPRIIDIDNDGLLDLLIGNYSGTLYHYEQTSETSMEFSHISDSFNNIDVGRISTPSFTDIDNDGLIDLIVGEEDGNLNHYEQDQDNSYSFSLKTESFSDINIGLISTPCFTDLNNDGLLDLIVGENVGPLHYFKQSSMGSTTFDSVTSDYLNFKITQPCPVFIDFNNNGLMDLMIGDIYGYVRHYEQPSSESDSVILITKNVLPDHDFGSEVYPFLFDIDNNQRMDLFVGTSDRTIQHLEQNSTGSSYFTVVTDSFSMIDLPGGYFSPIFVDLDQNGLLDLIFGYSRGYLEHYEQASEDSMVFIKVSDRFNDIDVGEFSTPCFYDLDGDSLWDMLIGNGEGMIYHYEQAVTDSFRFNLISEAFNDIDVSYMAKPSITDLNDDGQLDLIIGNSSGKLSHYEQSPHDPVLFSPVTENFANITISNSTKPHFADINADGLDDLIIGEGDGGVYYYQRDKETNINVYNSLIRNLELKPNYPNPFNSTTTVRFELAKQSNVKITIYNNIGIKIIELINTLKPAGYHSVKWDGKNQTGQDVCTGIYYYVLVTEDLRAVNKMLYLK